MTTSRSDLFSLAEKRLSWLGARQNVLAANIANASTPAYRPQDVLPFQQVLDGHVTMAPSITQQGHLSGMHPAGAVPTTQTRPTVRSIDGNGVQLDEQLMQVAQTESDQSLVAAVWKKYAAMLNTALGR